MYACMSNLKVSALSVPRSTYSLIQIQILAITYQHKYILEVRSYLAVHARATVALVVQNPAWEFVIY